MNYPRALKDMTYVVMVQQQITAEQQPMFNPQGELQAARGQVLALTQSHDQLRRAYGAPDAEVDRLFRQMRWSSGSSKDQSKVGFDALRGSNRISFRCPNVIRKATVL